jgi:hypothetical protein
MPELKLGAFNRRVLAAAEPGRGFAALEDDFHHFHAEIAHDGERVTAVAAQALRYPRSTCPEAIERLQQFVGMPLDAASTGIDGSWQCTHMYELARLAIAQARRGPGSRLYEICVPDRIARRTRAEIRRDGTLLLAWDFEGKYIVAPERFAGLDIYGRIRWPEDMHSDELEAAMLLRRGAWLSIARGTFAPSVEAANTPGGVKYKRHSPGSAACYSYQPEIAARATEFRIENRRDFTGHPGDLLAELERPLRPRFTLKKVA